MLHLRLDYSSSMYAQFNVLLFKTICGYKTEKESLRVNEVLKATCR
ncbi:hypothetical protein ALT721_850006 [Alteromonas alvinellae]